MQVPNCYAEKNKDDDIINHVEVIAHIIYEGDLHYGFE